jgi:deazaflavin-dependent oxidoreductase (nitroreductase family)
VSRLVATLCAGLALVGGGRAEEEPLPEVGAALARIAGASNLEITTVGRRTGREHTRTIWFVVAGGRILVQAGKGGRTDWYRNLQKTPGVVVRQGDYVFRAEARPVTDPERVAEIHRLFLDKYTTARLLSFVGSSIGRGAPVELTPISVAVRR